MHANNNMEELGTILVVDDEPAVLILIKTILNAAKYRALVSNCGADAIRLAQQKHLRLDAAILDVRIPETIPAELARELALLRPRLPILFMSGFIDDQIIRVRMLNEYAGFLPKPFKPDGLLRAVRECMVASSACDYATAQPAPEAWRASVYTA